VHDLDRISSTEGFDATLPGNKVMNSFVRTWVKKKPTRRARRTLLHVNNARPHLAPETLYWSGLTRFVTGRLLAFDEMKATLKRLFFQEYLTRKPVWHCLIDEPGLLG
jgi:hypothetical protein